MKRLFPDVFGKGGNALGVCGGGFSGCFSFLVLGLFHIVIVAGTFTVDNDMTIDGEN